MQHFATTNGAPSAAYLQGTIDLVPLVYGGGGTLDGKTFTIIPFSGTPHSGTLAAPTGPSDVATQVQAASGGEYTCSLTTIGAASYLRITDGTTGDTSALEADAGTMLPLVGLTAGQASEGSSNADPFPTAIAAIQNGDPLNTANHQLMMKPVAEALGHLKNTKGSIAGSNNWGGTQTFTNIKLTSRSRTRTIPITWVKASDGKALIQAGPTLPANDNISGPIKLPHGATLTAYTLWVDPFDAGVLPASKVSFNLTKRAIATGADAPISPTLTDPAANFAAYEAPHGFGPTGLAEVIDNVNYHYYAYAVGEDVLGNPVTINGLTATCTITSVEEWQD